MTRMLGDRPLVPVRRGSVLRVLIACALGAALAGPVPLAGQEGRKLALIIAISEYGEPPANPKTGEALRPYRDLNAKNDVPLVRGALLRQGFRDDDIRLLQDADADAAGIREAFGVLARAVRPGDVVVLHYSGHGHRLGNDDPERDEEVDGYDEVLVPHGAPDEFYDGYDGSLHIRDDELGVLLATLRERAGPTGNVTFFLDACYSGTATRGDDGELAARGSVEPLGPPNPPDAGGEADGTGIETGGAAGTRGSGDGLAPFAVFSAASQRQVAYETWDVDGRTRVGSLSYALARTLPEAAPGTSYRALFAEVARVLSGKVRQTPQVEGVLDAMLFSDRLVPQQPYVEVSGVSEDGRFAVLSGGSLLGLNAGTRLLVHPAGATHAASESALATLVVRESQPLEAIAEIAEGALEGGASGSWAFVVARSYGDLATRVRLAPGLPERDVEGLTRVFRDLGIVELVEEGADVVVEPGRPMLGARTVQGGIPLGRGPAEVGQRVEEFARNQYLRRVSFTDEEIRVALELSPVEIERDLLGRARGCGPADWTPDAHPGKSLGGGQWRLALGDAYRLRVRNTGERRAFIAVLDLLPHGPIKVLRPREGESPASYELEPGVELDLGCYQLTDQTGHETLKVFATDTPQDFRGLFESRGTRGPGGGDLSELEQLVRSTYASTRSGEVGAPRGLATTVALQIHITEIHEGR